MSESQTGGEWTVIDHDNNGNRVTASSRSEAEDKAQTARDYGSNNVEILAPGETTGDAKIENELVVTEELDQQHDVDAREGITVEPEAETSDLPSKGDIGTDPLDFLPDYMIDHVQGTPTLNKRGLSVLAFHYGVTTTNREIIASPHETNWESAIVETTVKNQDDNTFVGTGTAHVNRGDDAEILLELAETRSYKRAVSFATGTGIVSYQEMVGELE